MTSSTFHRAKIESGKKILITGGTGFIGRHVVAFLVNAGCSVGVLTSKKGTASFGNSVDVLQGDFFDLGRLANVVEGFKPELVIHLAWDVSKGFWTSANNSRWAEASLTFFEMLMQTDVKKITIAGSCAELGNSTPVLSDSLSLPLGTDSSYGLVKHQLWGELLSLSKKHGRCAANGRIFFPIGIGEADFKLVTYVTRCLLRGDPAIIKDRAGVKDFIDARDVGEAMARLSISDVDGVVDIGNGGDESIDSIINQILKSFDENARSLLKFECGDHDITSNQILAADPRRLIRELGFHPKIAINDSVTELVTYLQNS